MPDHVHLLFQWRTDESLATLMRKLKAHSSRWAHETLPAFSEFAWQEGYGAFSVSSSQTDVVKHYIANQPAHHRGRTFQEEFLQLLRVHGIEFDERYIWD